MGEEHFRREKACTTTKYCDEVIQYLIKKCFTLEIATDRNWRHHCRQPVNPDQHEKDRAFTGIW